MFIVIKFSWHSRVAIFSSMSAKFPFIEHFAESNQWCYKTDINQRTLQSYIHLVSLRQNLFQNKKPTKTGTWWFMGALLNLEAKILEFIFKYVLYEGIFIRQYYSLNDRNTSHWEDWQLIIINKTNNFPISIFQMLM